MFKFWRSVATLWVCLIGIAPAASMAGASKDLEADGWWSLGSGFYDGKDYPVPQGEQKRQKERVGGMEAFTSFNYAGAALLRIRASAMLAYTNNRAEEIGMLVGIPLVPQHRKSFLAVGVSRLTDVSNTKHTPTVGVPVELLVYPTRGLELSLHGNFNPDSNFIGFTVGGVFGKRRDR